MRREWIEAAQREGRRVAVVMGAIAAEVNPAEACPMVVPAVVIGPQPEDGPGVWWLDLEVGDELVIPQMYREADILGLWGVTDGR